MNTLPRTQELKVREINLPLINPAHSESGGRAQSMSICHRRTVVKVYAYLYGLCSCVCACVCACV